MSFRSLADTTQLSEDLILLSRLISESLWQREIKTLGVSIIPGHMQKDPIVKPHTVQDHTATSCLVSSVKNQKAPFKARSQDDAG